MKRRFPTKNKVLLVNITRLGDMLQATPTIAGIKSENPGCKITVLVEKQFEDVCHSIPNIDQVLALDLGMTVRSLAREHEGIVDAFEYLSDFVQGRRDEGYDYCLNMSSSAYTALLLKLIGIERNGGWTSDEEGYRVIESDWAKLFATSVFHQNRQFNSLNLVDVFRLSADVEQHPRHLLINVERRDLEYAQSLVEEAHFTNTGPLIAIQAGASQAKRQWETEHFVKLVKILVEQNNARVILTGSKKELQVIDPIKAGVNSPNVFVTAGRTNIPQLSALLKVSNLLITGDTGPMHMSVAVGTPVVAMFLASAFGFETGPYSEGNLVLQPLINCGPCNPNKLCSNTECHDHMSPELIAKLTMMRLAGDVTTLPPDLVDPSKVIVYRTFFDEFGCYDMQPLSSSRYDTLNTYRKAYRSLWLDDLAGYTIHGQPSNRLAIKGEDLAGLSDVVKCAEQGTQFIKRLIALIQDVSAPTRSLASVSEDLSEVDRKIEQIGFHHSHLGPITRMFIFAKENLSGTEALDLASQMGRVYEDLIRRSHKLSHYYNTL